MIVSCPGVDFIAQTIVRSAQSRPQSAWLRCISDDRKLQAGDVWFAIPGQRIDPRERFAQVVDRMPMAIIAESNGLTDTMRAAAHSLPCPVYLVQGLREQAGDLAAELLQASTPFPSLIAVTGTNGKTSVTRWVAQCLSHLDQRCAVIGTLGAGFVDGQVESTGLTTPDAVSLQTAIAQMARAGARSVAMEASSIGLDQGRLNGCRFSVAAFTNLSRDHLDYHGTMQAYEQAKQRLFVWPHLRCAVINLDDPAAPRFIAVARQAAVSVIRVTTRPELADPDDSGLLVVQGQHVGGGMNVQLRHGSHTAQALVSVVGQFNLENVAVVAGILLASQHGLDAIAQALPHITPPPGRMQMLQATGHPLVVVDYAHTPDALEKALAALRPLAGARGGRLLCLFGCGGDRDPGKRPLMGQVAQRLADHVVVTSDNPRSEVPSAIIEAILGGMIAGPGVQSIEDRAQAIAAVIGSAAPADVVLLAGKGHETGQTIGDRTFPFSDVQQTCIALGIETDADGEVVR